MPTQPAINNPMNPTNPTAPASIATHTPTPWHYEIDDEFAGLCIHSEYGCVAQLCQTQDVDPESIATAQFITRACNSHAQLVAALKYAETVLNMAACNSVDYNGMPLPNALADAAADIRAALTAATEGGAM